MFDAEHDESLSIGSMKLTKAERTEFDSIT